MNLHQTKLDICEAGRRVYAQGYVASNDGNISCRIEEDRILTTPTGVSKGFLKPEDLCIVDFSGRKVSGLKNPSSEIGMHIFLYRERPDVRAVVHAHPPTATGFAVAGIPLTECVLPEVVITLGAIPIADYGTPGGPEISEPIRKYVKDYDAYLLENHGATTIGKDVMNAYYKMETMEHFAKILFVARQLGGANLLNEEQVAKLLKIRDRMGIRGPDPACAWAPQALPAAPAPSSSQGGIPTLRTKSAGGSLQPAASSEAPTRSAPGDPLVDEITRRVIETLRRRP
jgi:L-fuculose-phosphate aldolase